MREPLHKRDLVFLILHLSAILLNIGAIASLLWVADILKNPETGLLTRLEVLEQKMQTMDQLQDIIARAEEILGEDVN